MIKQISFSFLLMATALLASPLARAQLPEGVQRSSSPQGFHVQGGTAAAGTAPSHTNTAASSGKDSGPTNAVAAGKGGVQIQGNTRINATATSTNAAAVGQGNKAGNELGAIGGK